MFMPSRMTGPVNNPLFIFFISLMMGLSISLFLILFGCSIKTIDNFRYYTTLISPSLGIIAAIYYLFAEIEEQFDPVFTKIFLFITALVLTGIIAFQVYMRMLG